MHTIIALVGAMARIISNRLLLVGVSAATVLSLFMYSIHNFESTTPVGRGVSHVMLLLSILALMKACYHSAHTIDEEKTRLKQRIKILKSINKERNEGLSHWGLDRLSERLHLSLSKMNGWLSLKNYRIPWLLLMGASSSGKSRLIATNPCIWTDGGVLRHPLTIGGVIFFL